MGGARGPEQAVVQEALGRRVMSGGSLAAPDNPLLFVLSVWLETRNDCQKNFRVMTCCSQTSRVAGAADPLHLGRGSPFVAGYIWLKLRSVRRARYLLRSLSTAMVAIADLVDSPIARARRKSLVRQNSFAETGYAGVVHVHDGSRTQTLGGTRPDWRPASPCPRGRVGPARREKERGVVSARQRHAQTERSETHHAEEGPPQSVPKVVAPIAKVGPAEVGISSFPLAVLDHLFPRHLTL